MTSLNDSRFPAKIYTETVLAPCFIEAQEYFLNPLMAIHEAHALMLEKQKIISTQDAQTILKGLSELDLQNLRTRPYDGSVEDLFFLIEKVLTEKIGDETAGKLHTARSRNDIDITLYRMILREDLLSTIEAGVELTQSLCSLAEKHLQTVMPAHTHTQPAQPTTLAHYLSAAIDFLQRDLHRLQSAYTTVNQNPLGACAITTTGFPIDRIATTEYLGFDQIIKNSYGAISCFDYVAESLSALATSMLNLGRFNQDLLLWATQEFSFIRIGDAFVQKSSIMPQKRNPVALEHVRILASRALTISHATIQSLHNTPMGDINDAEDPIQPLIRSAFVDSRRAMKLLSGVLGAVEIDVARLHRLASGSYLTLTELADTLVREEGVSFREAHRLCSETLKSLGSPAEQPTPSIIIAALAPIARARLGHDLRTPTEKLLKSLDPLNFVQVRTVVGGPAPKTVHEFLTQAYSTNQETLLWLQKAQLKLKNAGEIRSGRIETLLASNS